MKLISKLLLLALLPLNAFAVEPREYFQGSLLDCPKDIAFVNSTHLKAHDIPQLEIQAWEGITDTSLSYEGFSAEELGRIQLNFKNGVLEVSMHAAPTPAAAASSDWNSMMTCTQKIGMEIGAYGRRYDVRRYEGTIELGMKSLAAFAKSINGRISVGEFTFEPNEEAVIQSRNGNQITINSGGFSANGVTSNNPDAIVFMERWRTTPTREEDSTQQLLQSLLGSTARVMVGHVSTKVEINPPSPSARPHLVLKVPASINLDLGANGSNHFVLKATFTGLTHTITASQKAVVQIGTLKNTEGTLKMNLEGTSKVEISNVFSKSIETDTFNAATLTISKVSSTQAQFDLCNNSKVRIERGLIEALAVKAFDSSDFNYQGEAKDLKASTASSSKIFVKKATGQVRTSE